MPRASRAPNTVPKQIVAVIGQTPTGEGKARDMRINEIQEQVGRGEYRVDLNAVAEAIIRRMMEEHYRTASASNAGRAG